MNHPAPISSITDSAICPTTRILPAQILALLPVSPRPASFNVLLTLTRADLQAGARPKIRPVSSETPMVKKRTRSSGRASSATEPARSPTKATSSCTPYTASRLPSNPPAMESIRLSVRNCRTMRARPAPSARRTPISFCRAVARASSRFATLAQAMTSTSATTAISTYSGSAMLPRRLETPAPASCSTKLCFRMSGWLCPSFENSVDPNFGAATLPGDFLLTRNPVPVFDYTLTNDTILNAGRVQPAINPPAVPQTYPTFYRSEEHTSELQSLRHLVCRL